MDKNDFKIMVEKYKDELMKMAGLKVNAAEIENFDSQSQGNLDSTENKDSLPQDGSPYSAGMSVDESSSETYQNFLSKNKQFGYLKVQAFAARQAVPVSGVSVVISKIFSDGTHVFFEGITDESGIVDNIELPAPEKALSEQPSDILSYANYDFYSSFEGYKTENAKTIQIFQGVKTIQPVQVIPE